MKKVIKNKYLKIKLIISPLNFIPEIKKKLNTFIVYKEKNNI